MNAADKIDHVLRRQFAKAPTAKVRVLITFRGASPKGELVGLGLVAVGNEMATGEVDQAGAEKLAQRDDVVRIAGHGQQYPSSP